MGEEYTLWARKIRGQRIIMSDTEPCDPTDPQEALLELCRRMDVPRPLWLNKHEKEYHAFGRTAFAQDHFIESIPFTKLEIELIVPENLKKKGPRNPLME